MWRKLLVVIAVVVFAFPVAALICWPIVKIEKFVKPRIRSWFKPIRGAFDDFSIIIMYGWWDWRDDRAKKRRLKEIERQQELESIRQQFRKDPEETAEQMRLEAMTRSMYGEG